MIVLPRIEEYAVKSEKRESFWICFNTEYNDFHVFKKDILMCNPYNKDFTDYKKRDEFIQYIKINFSYIKLIEVFDLASTGTIILPYLGSLAIDCEKDDVVYKAIENKYENPLLNNAVVYSITYEYAKECVDKRTEFMKNELDCIDNYLEEK